MNIVFFEMIFISYFLYQLHALSWQRSLLIFLESYREHVSQRGAPTVKKARKLASCFDIYKEIGQLHGKVSKTWLKSSAVLFTYMYTSAHMSAYTAYCLYNRPELGVKLRFFFLIEIDILDQFFLIEVKHMYREEVIMQRFARFISGKASSKL
ncbi:uncharacterized protein Dwil_GK28017 [Drosophila willistoni]|uniref:Uncharacterized protein n=1 Tax=Drosophila willistoni TaxID=7260 RepID=A0A0Q9WRV5_DROWI|nr:uncharacterized protein Dwil_GK28017 [Drosophila willistoni]